MINSPTDYSSDVRALREEMIRLGAKLGTTIIGVAIDPRLGLAISISVSSIIALKKLGVVIKRRKLSEHVEEVKARIFELEKRYEEVREEQELQYEALRRVQDEFKRSLIEDRLKTIALELKNISDERCYEESLLNALKYIESLRYKHGKDADKIYEKIIELSIKASEGKLEGKEVDEVIEKIKNLVDKHKDFPTILLMIAREELK